MHTDDTPDQRPEKPHTDHHFETPIVREAQPGRVTREEDDDATAGAPERRPAPGETAVENRWKHRPTTSRSYARRGLRPVGGDQAAVGTRQA